MKQILLLLCAFALAACDANAVAPQDLPPDIADNARALELRLTSDAARFAAEQAVRQATNAAANQRAAEARITAVAQSTRDAVNLRSTSIAQNATGTAVLADASATRQARADAQTATRRADERAYTATTQADQRNTTATALAFAETDTARREHASATARAATSTRASERITETSVAMHLLVAQTRTANQIKEENDRAFWTNLTMPVSVVVSAVLWALLPLALFGLLVFFVWRVYALIEARHRVVEKNGHVILVLPPATWNGAPQYKMLLPGEPLMDPAPTAPPLTRDETDEGEIVDATPKPFAFTSLSLDLADQPRSLHVPLGVTEKHPAGWWLPLVELDSVLVAGARRMGKSNFLHTWIQALLHGRSARLILYDGKGGVEFDRYANAPRTESVTDLADALGALSADMARRWDLFRHDGARDLQQFNERHGTGGRLERIVLVVDELAYALQQDGVEQALADLIARGGACGIHPVLATQHPSSDVITPLIKANLGTRIAFGVPTATESRVILGRGGAENLDETGRLLLKWGKELIEAQAFVALDNVPGLSRARVQFTNAVLSERETKLARTALDQLGGWFKQKELAKAADESTRFVGEVALRWQGLGYLTEVLTDAGGRRLGRRLTERLIHLVSS